MTYARHDTLPMVRTSNTKLGTLLALAQSKFVNAFVFGSSLHTINGAGSQFANWLNYAAACAYGQSSATPWMPVTSLTYNATYAFGQWGANASKGDWTGCTGVSYEGNGEADIATSVPGFEPRKWPSGSSIAGANMLEFDCGSVSQDAGGGIPFNFFPHATTDKYRFEMIIHSYGGLGSESVAGNQIRWSAQKYPQYKPSNIYFVGGTQIVAPASYTLPNSAGVNSSTPGAFLSYIPSDNSGTPYDFTMADATNPYLSCLFDCYGLSNPCFVSAVRWRLVGGTSPRGLTFSLAGAGGWGSGDLLTSHSSFGQTLSVMQPDLVIVAYHCNSAYIGHQTPDTYYANILAICKYIRKTNPAACIVLAGDHFRYDSGYNATDEDNHSRYTGADFTLVDQGYADAAINSHLACDRGPRLPTNTDPTGLTFKGAWAATTSYAVGDVVRQNGTAGRPEYFKCVQAHTSSTADQPGLTLTLAHRYWVRWFADGSGTDSTSYNPVTSGDIIHLNPWGQRQEAEIWWNLMKMAALNSMATFDSKSWRNRFAF